MFDESIDSGNRLLESPLEPTLLPDTLRLSLRPFAPRELVALIDEAGGFERLTGLRLAKGLREFYSSGDVSPVWLAELRAATTADVWRHGVALIRRETGEVIGTAGFKGPPDDNGAVEIAYGVTPDHQSQGYATEAAHALTDFAFRDPSVRLVRAHTLPTANASTRVLTNCGFHFLSEVIDPEDGPVWRWEFARAEASV